MLKNEMHKIVVLPIQKEIDDKKTSNEMRQKIFELVYGTAMKIYDEFYATNNK